METINKTPDKPVLIKLADKLKETQQEVDELVLQFSLGKAEAKDKFEEIKQEFRFKVAEFKQSDLGEQLSFIASDVKSRLETLEKHLSAGKAESHRVFKEQKTKIDHTLDQLEVQLRKLMPQDREYFEQEIEKFEIKLEILRLWFSLKKIEAKASFKGHMKEAGERIDRLMEKIRDTFEPDRDQYHHFKDEIRQAYDHLRRAVHSL